jgi:KipI family sensor histidine kinase inhibitor
MNVIAYGSDALLIKLDGGVSDRNLLTIKIISDLIKQSFRYQIIELIPAYDTILIRFRVESLSIEEVREYLSDINITIKPGDIGRRLEIPVCFHSSFALDQDRVVALCNKPIEDIKRLILHRTYQVHMMGFLPGFAFMAGVDTTLHCPRLSVPRKSVPAGSVAITGEQIAIYPVNSPGGWNIIGHCPLAIFDVTREEFSLFRAYDQVAFKPITLDEHRRITSKVSNHEYDYKQLIAS